MRPVWFKSREEATKSLGFNPFPSYAAGNFRYHFMLQPPYTGFRERWAMLRFYLKTGRRIFRERRFDCIVAYGFSLTAFAGVLLKWSTGAKLVIEIPSDPGKSYVSGESNPGLFHRLASWSAVAALHFAALFADRASLLYPTQLSRFPLLRNYPGSVIHAFVPVSVVPRKEITDKYVLLAGFPWYLKGADIAIQAFRMLSNDFPDITLKILCHYSDRGPLDAMIGDCRRIELLGGLPFFEALQVIAGALVVVLPSRTEGMGRVLVEAMAAGRPCVASAVGGIPHYIRDGYNGLLTEPANAADLSEKLRRVLADDGLRDRLAANGHAFAHEELSEAVFARKFRQMLDSAVGKESSVEPVCEA